LASRLYSLYGKNVEYWRKREMTMKKGSIVLWSIITYVVVCLLELIICNSSIIHHLGMIRAV